MSIFSKVITRNPQKIGEMRDMGINLNDFEGPIDTSTFGGLIKKAMTRVQPTGIMNQPFIGRDFSMFDQAKMGQLPIAPGYNEEMDIDDTGRITLGDRFRDLADRAQEGILNTLTGQDTRSSLTRAGLGSILFGFNPLTAILGAFAGSKLPGITSAFQQGKFNPLEFVREKRRIREEQERAAEELARRGTGAFITQDSFGGDYGQRAGGGDFSGRGASTDITATEGSS
tara:strand:+ start:279 stop:962 length:684 start_codon:yes stop_codon:yes gene_type:complete